MYREDYIPDGPEGAIKFDYALGAEYKIENGKRIYMSEHDARTVPEEKGTDVKILVITIMSIMAACILAAGITVMYIIIKSIHHVQ